MKVKHRRKYVTDLNQGTIEKWHEAVLRMLEVFYILILLVIMAIVTNQNTSNSMLVMVKF